MMTTISSLPALTSVEVERANRFNAVMPIPSSIPTLCRVETMTEPDCSRLETLGVQNSTKETGQMVIVSGHRNIRIKLAIPVIRTTVFSTWISRHI
jgi:hypothetical protein